MTPHSTVHGEGDAASAWVLRFSALITPGGSVLDVACGHGRHCRGLAERGFRVTGVDRDTTALASLNGLRNVTTVAADLEDAPWPLSGVRFDAVVVTRYLHRPLFPVLLDAVAADGVFLYETFTAGNEAFGKPSNPAFLLAPGELLAVVGARFTVLAFEQGLTTDSKPQVVQRVAAVGRAHHWPIALPV